MCLSKKLVALLYSFTLLFMLLGDRKAYAVYSLTELGAFTDNSTAVGSWFGAAIKTGDWNGDGYPDFFTSSPYISSNTGRIYIFFGGQTLNTTADVILSGETAGDIFGNDSNPGATFAVADINEDGFDDVIAGAYQRDEYGTDAGEGYIFFGGVAKTGTISAANADVVFSGNTTDRRNFGTGALAGDFNGDGDLDVAFTTRLSTTATASVGALIIYFGDGDSSFDNTHDLLINNLEATRFTFNGIGVGDVNGDGYDDIFAADTSSVTSSRNQYVYFGGVNMDSTYDLKFTPPNTSDLINRGAVALGDLNNDGSDDICFGNYTFDSPFLNAGRVYCFLSEGLNWSGTYTMASADIIFSGSEANANFGRSVDINDFNQDGNMDLLVGAYQVDGSDNGYVQIFLGNGTDAFNTTADFTFRSSDLATPTIASNFGNSVSSGDLDNDGWVDLFLSQASGGNGTGLTGKTYIFEFTHGAPTVTITTNEVISNEIMGVAEDSSIPFSNIQWSTSNESNGNWNDCTSLDGSFDSTSEEFSCDISGISPGLWTIYIRTVDSNGLYMSSSLFVSKSITVDRTAPQQLVFEVNKRDSSSADETPSYIRTKSARLSFSAIDSASSVTYMRISEDLNKLGQKAWREYDNSIGWEFAKDGRKKLYVQFKDVAGNTSDVYQQSITVDTLPPEFSILKLNNQDFTYTQTDLSQHPRLDLQGELMDFKFNDRIEITVNDKRYRGDAATTSEVYLDYANKKWWTNSLPLNFGNNVVSLKAIDKAGNKSDTVTFNVLVY